MLWAWQDARPFSFEIPKTFFEMTHKPNRMTLAPLPQLESEEERLRFSIDYQRLFMAEKGVARNPFTDLRNMTIRELKAEYDRNGRTITAIEKEMSRISVELAGRKL
jgi:hypothetical protein